MVGSGERPGRPTRLEGRERRGHLQEPGPQQWQEQAALAIPGCHDRGAPETNLSSAVTPHVPGHDDTHSILALLPPRLHHDWGMGACKAKPECDVHCSSSPLLPWGQLLHQGLHGPGACLALPFFQQPVSPSALPAGLAQDLLQGAERACMEELAGRAGSPGGVDSRGFSYAPYGKISGGVPGCLSNRETVTPKVAPLKQSLCISFSLSKD